MDTPTKRCSKCNHEYPATTEYFHKSSQSEDGLRGMCKVCRCAYSSNYYQHHKDTASAYSREYRVNHPEQSRAYSLAWYYKNSKQAVQSTRNWRQKTPGKQQTYKQTRRSRSLGLPDNFSHNDWEYALKYFNGCCAVCGRPQGLWHTLAQDHWIPLSSPDCPGTVATNIVPLCHGVDGCNNSKGNKSPEQWLVEKFGKRKAARILKRIQIYFAAPRE